VRIVVRRFAIRQVIPFLLCVLPLVGGALVLVATPNEARRFYLDCLKTSYLDWLILGFGLSFFFLQLLLAFRALQWQERGFNLRPDPMLQRLHQAADWFPLLGLFGTVAAILQTFAAIGMQESVPQREIIRLYAPALTATGSGLLMAFLNLIPLWLVAMGRSVILSLAMTPVDRGVGAS
jgi:hypothetical protein